MKKKMLFLFLGILSAVFLMSSCEWKPANKKGKDGYYFEQSQWVRTEFPVEIVLVQSRKEMKEEISKRMSSVDGKIKAEDVAAFAVVSPTNTKCVLYILDPKVHYEPEFIGHELVHCIYGSWHSEPQKRSQHTD
jgi:hypothetical protein